ncbi:MAG: Ig-like domain-containing protein [Pseudomonadota bacterium]
MDNTSFVDQLYHRFFGRGPDAAGRAFWVHALEAGAVDPVRLTNIFLDSGEFSGLVQSVSSLYYTAFGRIPDSGGLAFWLHQAQSGMALDTISTAFTASGEYQQRYSGNSDAGFIDLLYVGALGRLPAAATRAHWLGEMAAGASRASVLTAISQSTEVIGANGAAYKVIAEYQGITSLSPTQSQIDGALAQQDPLALIASLYDSAAYQGVALPNLGHGTGHGAGVSLPNQAPTLDSSMPAKGGTGATSELSLSFSEDVHAGSGYIIITDGATQTSINHTSGAPETRIVGATDTRTVAVGDTSQVTFSAQQLSIHLSKPLLDNTHYSIQIASGVIVDGEALSYAGLSDASKLSFTSGDSNAPPPPTGINLDKGSDTGSSDGDLLTNDTTPTLNGRAEPLSSVTLYAGASNLGTVTADANGNWTKTVGALGAGTFTFTATATDAGNHVSNASTGLVVHIDTSAPTVTSVVLSDSTLTTGETASVTVTVSEAVPSISASNFSTVSNGSVSNFSSSDGGLTWIGTFTPDALTTGSDNVLSLDGATVTDRAGNAGSPATVSSSNYIVDTFLPLAQVGAAIQINDSALGTDFITNIASQTISGTFTGTLAQNEFIQVKVDNNPYVATIDSPGHWSLAMGSMTEGEHAVFAQVINNVLEHSTPVTQNFTIDLTGPSVTGTSPANLAANVANNSNIVFTLDQDVVNANTGGFIKIVHSGDVEIHVPLSDPQVTISGNTVTYKPSSDLLNDKLYQFTLPAGSVADVAGNGNHVQTFSIQTPDTIPPAIPDAPTLDSGSDTGGAGYNADNITKLSTFTLNGHGPSSSGIDVYDGTTLVDTTATDANGNWTRAITVSGSGLHILSAKAFDSSGNHSAASGALNVTIDGAGPTVTSLAMADNALSTGETSVVNISFSELVQTLDESNFSSLGNGHLSAFATSNHIDWTALYTPNTEVLASAQSLAIDQSTLRDVAANAGPAGTVGSAGFDVNTTIPTALAGAAFSLSADSGASGDYIAKSASQTLSGTYSGTLAAGQYVALTIDGGTPIHATDNGSNSWSTSAPLNLAEGSHSVSVSVTSASGLFHSAAFSHNVTIDASAPTFVSNAPVTFAHINNLGSNLVFTFSEVIAIANPAGLITLTDVTHSVVQQIALSNSQVTVAGNTLTLNPTADLTDIALYTASLDANALSDVAGNLAPGRNFSFTTDTVAPSEPSAFRLSASSDLGFNSDDNITNDTTPSFSGHAEANATVNIYTDNGSLWIGSGVANGDGIWSATSSVTLSEGTHGFTAAASDLAGNVGVATSALSVLFDTSAPTLAAPLPTTIHIGESQLAIHFSEDVSVDANLAAGSHFLTFDDGAGDVHAYDVSADLYSDGPLFFDRMDELLPFHTYTITLDAGSGIDRAGNGTPLLTGSIITPLPTPSVPDLSAATDSGPDTADDITSNTMPTFTGTSSPNGHVALYADGILVGTGATDLSGNYSLTPSGALAEGEHAMTVRYVDDGGHHGPESDGLTVKIDTSAPASFTIDNTLVGPQDQVALTFNETVASTGLHGILIRDALSHALVTTIAITEALVEGTSLIFTLDANVLAEHDYEVAIETGALTDAAGNLTTIDLVGSNLFSVVIR